VGQIKAQANSLALKIDDKISILEDQVKKFTEERDNQII